MEKISLRKDNITCEMLIIKKRINDKLSILIETDTNNNCYSYSIKSMKIIFKVKMVNH